MHLDDFLTGTRVPRSRLPRLSRATRDQWARTPRCPAEPRLEGKLALVTGGSAGIGLETTRGLLQRGAEVIVASRDDGSANRVLARLRDELGPHIRAHVLRLDLCDLHAVATAAQDVAARFDGRMLDIVVANAGAKNSRYAASPQGHELTFASNVLGHFLLLRLLLPRIRSGARIVMVTGDIYCIATACSSDYQYRTRLGGWVAYARSKLGDLWLASELQRRRPDLVAVAVHPGVVDSGLGKMPRAAMESAEIAPSFLRRRVFLDCERGAQTSLIAATQLGIEPGAYYHNTMGRMELPDGDPALDVDAAKALWDRCESLAADWLNDQSGR